MKRTLLIEHTPNIIRTALFEDEKLSDIHQERRKSKKLTESLFLGRVQAIRPSVCAAFIDIGEPLNAFLPLGENSTLKCGDYVIVQGTAVQAVDTKGLRVTDAINLAGKWLVLVPEAGDVRISKKIKDTALRESLLEAVTPLCPEGCGLIVRTASGDVTLEALSNEVQELHALWQSVCRKAEGARKPGVIHAPLSLDMRSIRDLGGTLGRVITNSSACFEQLLEAKQSGWLQEEAKIELFSEERQLMCDAFALDMQTDKALKKRVWLDCGGYLVFDNCEAMTVVDVNSGKMVLGRNTEDTALRVNLEAAQEIARQIRLRDIGGMIVADFIDMREEAHRMQLIEAMKTAVLLDRAKVHVYGMTRLGLLEMARTRKGEQLSRAMQTACKVCGGDGVLLSAEEAALRALRQIRRMHIAGQRGPFLIKCSVPSANALAQMQIECDTPVFAMGENGKHAAWFDIQQLDVNAQMPKGAVQLKKG